ncbi:Na+/H+ antiporter NhaC family protein [Rodentibacter pneumotropicus]|uniref:Na+/H+ antiporter NhaC family protein n=1 Tax=Rodentibacter pneumotropicus TaxID=758 RepID=UPI00109CEF09|nr:Na+/H+ antiporter NhaC family protein [Rodentibacter pneumotropicus]NBH75744.1 Na+/H+ antiporter NhaC family protein [Rodentibacter pneumotropicus]THA04858.1 Na+/H+ antiporter NhaC family protein [Rodentibacter pneumotropicus]THA12957.1 Na+/H+ antiporter NhaC family protein [Rodentibacter pneumotropicus]
MELIDYSSSIWSISPALLAILLAIVTRRVLVSLSSGILVGALMLNNASLLPTFIYLKDNIASLVYSDGAINSNMNIVLFLILLGVLTALLTVSGSNRAFVEWAQKRIKDRRGAKLLAASLVFVTFIDDYFHSLAVGAIARPVTDRFKVSRAKLAYILDSTAAPMCVMMPVSSWGAYIITLVAGLLTTYSITEYTPIWAFMAMSAMNYYAIFALLMVFFVAYFSFDIASMARHEKAAMTRENQEKEEQLGVEGHVRNLVFPILILIVATVSMMIYTGGQVLTEAGSPFSVLGAFENTNVGVSLVVGGGSAVIISTVLIMLDGQISFGEYARAWKLGVKSMSGAIAILFFAWTINKVVGDMQTGKYLSSLVSNNIPVQFLPVLLFILASAMAFSTGTSWGTFGIMLPIAASMATNAAPELMLACLSAVMAGAVCGDHCSPVSDTTILSSTGAKCNHMDHVTTQLPYALTVAAASCIGYITVGFTESGVAGFVATAVSLVILVFIVKKR